MSNYKLEYIKTGTILGRCDLLYQGGDQNSFSKGPVTIYFIRLNKGVLLIDTSFHINDIEDLGMADSVSRSLPDEEPMYALKNAGIKNTDVTKIIMTHLHVDHSGYFNNFPNAKIYIHKKELSWITELPAGAIGYSSLTFPKINKVTSQIIPINTEWMEIESGIETMYVGGHSPGSIAVLVSSEKGKICICSDNCFSYKNIEEGLPIGLAMNSMENVIFYEYIS
ncbi:MAG: MBL fold metallo-hydrolase [Actinobacteria bacterium]|nr:MBL fold metallo-hydrolase [Actinomycetota bacterium]